MIDAIGYHPEVEISFRGNKLTKLAIQHNFDFNQEHFILLQKEMFERLMRDICILR